MEDYETLQSAKFLETFQNDWINWEEPRILKFLVVFDKLGFIYDFSNMLRFILQLIELQSLLMSLYSVCNF